MKPFFSTHFFQGRRMCRLVLPALLALALPVLGGCHGSRGLRAFAVPENFDTSKEYEITFWAKNDTNKTQTAIYERAIDDFESLYPNITVNLRLYTDYGKIYNDVITNIATNTTPNVCITYPDHIATYLSGTNLVVPLEELMTDERYGLGGSEILFDSTPKDEIIPQFLEECSFGGHYYALPFMRSTEACYINRTYVEALGYELPKALTWDFVWEVSEAAMEQDGEGNFLVNGQKVMIPFIYKSTDNMMISSYPANFLNAGQCIFAIDSTAGATWMGTDAPLSDISQDKLVRFETEVMAIPQFDPDHPQMISQGPSVCVFNKTDPGEVLASWLFTQYLLTNEVQIAYSQTEGYVPVTSKARETDEYRDYLAGCGQDDEMHYDVKIKAANLLLDNVGNTFVTPVFNGSASLRDGAGQLIENTVKSVRRRQEVNDEYMDKLYSDVASLYRLDQPGGKGEDVSGAKKELGKLPATSVILLSSLAGVWLLIFLYLVLQASKNKRNKE